MLMLKELDEEEKAESFCERRITAASLFTYHFHLSTLIIHIYLIVAIQFSFTSLDTTALSTNLKVEWGLGKVYSISLYIS